MRVSLNWLKELVEYNLSPKELAEILSLRSIGVKQVTEDFIELDLTYNRGDLLSIRGVAREVAAITDSKVSFDDKSFSKYIVPQTPVKVENSKLCPVYCVAAIENLKVEHSHDKWVKKLSESGMRSVNTVADVTNLIMLEFGQPMHAFDGRGVKDESIIVRLAKNGERITTLDGKTRDLDPSDLLIADSLNALGIAGVMGGKDSEVSNTTTTILLEAAIFDPVQIRRTATRLGLHSEASKRFQHGLTKTNLLQALAAAIKMYESLGGKLTAINLVGELEEQPKTVTLTLEKINSLLGVDIPVKQVESSLKQLGFSLGGVSDPPPRWKVTVPYWRLDIEIEEDLVEEVARMYGYEKIDGKPLVGSTPKPLDESLQNFIHDLKVKLSKAGLTEVQTYSFYSTDILNNLGWLPNKLKYLVKIANPISSETEYLRLDLWHNLLETVSKNINRGHKDICIFEVGKVYYPKKGSLPDEHYNLCLALVNETNNPMAELNLIMEKILKSLSLYLEISNKLGWYEKKFFHPNRVILYKKNGKNVGGLGEVHPRIVNRFGIEQRVAVVEISVEKLLA